MAHVMPFVHKSVCMAHDMPFVPMSVCAYNGK